MPHLAHCQEYLTSLSAALMMAAMPTEHEPRLMNRLRVARAEEELSQERLARAAGVSRQTISSIETGQYCPSALLAFQLAKVLNVGVEELFQLEEGTR